MSGRMMALLAALTLVLIVRTWDPLGAPNEAAGAPVSAAIERRWPISTASHPVSSPEALHAHSLAAAWPPRTNHAGDAQQAGNAFMTRMEAAQLTANTQQHKHRALPPPPPEITVAAPPAPPPIEPAPPLNVIGTWSSGGDRGVAVFMSGPHGTLLAREGDVLLSQYKVQSISRQHITLLQNSNQRTWTLNIPAAPSALPSTPSR